MSDDLLDLLRIVEGVLQRLAEDGVDLVEGLPVEHLAGEQMASPDQIACMVETAVLAAERFYPAFQLACWTDKTPSEAMQVAIAESYGRA